MNFSKTRTKTISNISMLRIFLFYSSMSVVFCGPLLPVQATQGGVIPLPQFIRHGPEFFVLEPPNFRFNVTNGNFSCSILENALARYWKLISVTVTSYKEKYENSSILNDINCLGRLDVLNIVLGNSCMENEHPYLNMDENYTLILNESRRKLEAQSIWGILRGLETFTQTIHTANDEFTPIVNLTVIEDFPRFSHRGLMVDTSRHFIPIDKILLTLEAMAFNKLNVFHWHIVDDQSFPYKSLKFPELSENGSYHPIKAVYDPKDVQEIIEYARNRGIRVMVEFDTPGHTLSWGKAMINILTKCVGISDYYGPFDPSKRELYDFLSVFFEEISQVFPDDYVHLGGDEVPFDCWESNENITDFMNKLNIHGDYSALESYYIRKLINIVEKIGLKSVVWEEVFDNGVSLSNSTIVHVWKEGYRRTLKKATEAGKFVILSSCWYLDHLGGLKDWENFYKCDPYNFKGSDAQKDLVLGGEACMWGEAVNENNIISRIWPRASATAEKLWSSITTRDDPNVNDDQILFMQSRIEEHTCRMNRRGIGAEPPNGPNFC